MKTEMQLADEAVKRVGLDRPQPRFLLPVVTNESADFTGQVETRLFTYPMKRPLGRVRWSGRPHEVPFKTFGPVDFYASLPIVLPPYRKESPHVDDETLLEEQTGP